ncbi:MAG: glycine cleavage system protein T [Boseongicola sp. SB0677_bin_26]|nr:glycine cleavage system protein T [Boseongicola sp. SB0665_bin_10]MYG24714.1 glycine cleavage system protein T [Boseongicola sp. SB0677_bin_26]
MTPHKGASLSFQPRIRKGAFFDASWRYGCRAFSVYNRTYISSTFSTPLEEYRKVTEDVAIWPVMGERQVEISGPDAAGFVQFLTPRDMTGCMVGQCKYALITSVEGGILCDPIILRLAEDRFWLSTSDCDLELWARGVAVHSPMRVKIRDAGVSVIQVQGPKSPRLMANLFGESILDLKYFRLAFTDFQGQTLTVSRTGWSGEFGYEIYLGNPDQGDALFDALMQAGSDCGVAPGAVSQARRIEAGILSWGVDMSQDENPYEVGLDRLVELDGTREFIGRAALARLKGQRVKRRLVGMRIEGSALDPNEDPWPLTRNGEASGRLTSLAYSPRLETNVALGLVPAEQAIVGTELMAGTWDGPRKARVSELPFLPKRQQGDARELLASTGT